MEDLKTVIAGNITELRKENKMTQLELAEKLNYSDKAVSKWERAESIPDVVVLKNIADLFGVTVDYLLQEEHAVSVPAEEISPGAKKKAAHGFIICMCILLVWLVGTFAFVVTGIFINSFDSLWLSFIYCVPISFIVWLVLDGVWFGGRLNCLIVSALMWTGLASIHITLITMGYNVWLLYILGVPGQAIIVTWASLKWKLGQEKRKK